MKTFTILASLFGLFSSADSKALKTCSDWGCPTTDLPFITRLKEPDKQRGYCNFETQKKSAGLSTIESHKLTEYVKQQFVNKFNEQFGTIKDEQYVKDLLNVRYEVSSVTNSVYPIMAIDPNKFHNTRLLRSIELNKTLNLGKFDIKRVSVPGVKAIRAIFNNITITPYETNNVDEFLKNEPFTVADTEIIMVDRYILTNGTETSGIFKLNDSDPGTSYNILHDFSHDSEVESELEEWFGAVRFNFENIAYDMKQLSQKDIENLVNK